MLKPYPYPTNQLISRQPPSGGCVLKLLLLLLEVSVLKTAAFRRLCVETCYCRIYDKAKEHSRLQAAVC